MAGTEMRKLIMWNIITLDGYFEGVKSWDLPWHDHVWGPELEQFSIEQLRSADYLSASCELAKRSSCPVGMTFKSSGCMTSIP
jgi:hypothetical protein